MNIYDLTAYEINEKLKNKEIMSVGVAQAFLDRIQEKEKDIEAFVSITADLAMKRAEELDSGSVLAGVPIGIKDNINVKGTKTTCSSKMLENFVSPYDATVSEKVAEAGMTVLGKLNMDEFAMGGSTENSAFMKTKNPWDLSRVPGGSSGGSAAAVAARNGSLGFGY